MHAKTPKSPSTPQGHSVPPCLVSFYVDDQLWEGHSVDFTETGIFVWCKHPPQLHTKLTLNLRFPDLHEVLEVQGIVVWTNRHGPNDKISPRGMGVHFVNPDPLVMRILASFSSKYPEHSHRYICYYR
jgi:Tfp pilus assembly protein PilZ